MPAAARELAQNNIKPGDVAASGPGGRLLKSDVQSAVEAKKSAPIVCARANSSHGQSARRAR